MVLDQGDTDAMDGDYIKRTAASAVSDGQAVTVNSDGEVVPADGASTDRVDGIVSVGADAGDAVNVYTGHGPIVAAVEAGTTAGSGVGAADTAGDDTAGNLSSAGAADYVALEDASTNYPGDAANAALVKRN